MPDAPPGRWRHLAAIAPLPGTVAIVLPALLIAANGTNIGWGLPGAAAALPVIAGAVLLTAGAVLVAAQTIALFDAEGEGTLAPWDPTRHLVVRGPYQRVRNPMITGVGLVLLGEAAVLGSPPIVVLFTVFAVVNAIYMPLSEEPGLAKRFGREYEEYRDNVPRWIPRLTPWERG